MAWTDTRGLYYKSEGGVTQTLCKMQDTFVISSVLERFVNVDWLKNSRDQP